MANPSPPPSCNDGLILSWFVRASNCWLEMVLGQKIRMIILRFLVWNAEILERSFSVILQHSELYNKVERTQLFYNLSLVLMLYFVDFHTLFIVLNVLLALLSQLLMSLPVPPSYLILLLRYENSSVVGTFIPFICIGGFFVCLRSPPLFSSWLCSVLFVVQIY